MAKAGLQNQGGSSVKLALIQTPTLRRPSQPVAMSVPSLPITLKPDLNGREAIADAVYRGVLSFDLQDEALFKSSLTSDAILELNGTVMNDLEAITAQCYDPVSKLDTTHFVTNMRINILEEDSKAEVTCSALAQHYRDGEGMEPGTVPLLVGSLYWLDLIKDHEDGLWKIKHWKLKSTWGQGDWGVFGR